MKSKLSVTTMSRIVDLKLKNMSLPDIANQLAREGFKTASGGGWYPSTVRQYLQIVSKALVAPSALGAPRKPRKLPEAA